MTMLAFRRLADKSSGERIKLYDEVTGEAYFLNPANGQREGWPTTGFKICDVNGRDCDPPKETAISTRRVAEGRSEGWISVEGEKVVHRPGGPVGNEWAVTHTFQQYDAIIFNTVDGQVRYKVVHQPDKYVDSDDPTEKVTKDHYAEGNTRVDSLYRLELEG